MICKIISRKLSFLSIFVKTTEINSIVDISHVIYSKDHFDTYILLQYK